MILIRDLGLVSELLASRAVILGVSAGAMNMGRYVADVWETKELYEGIGLTDIIVKGHYASDAWFIPALKDISMTCPVAVMEDESAIFIRADAVSKLGNIYQIDRGKISIMTDELIRQGQKRGIRTESASMMQSGKLNSISLPYKHGKKQIVFVVSEGPA